MEELLQKANINKSRLSHFVMKSAAKELSALSEPCYYPRTKKIYYEFLNLTRLTDKDVKDYVKRTYKGTKAEKWVLVKDPLTNLLIVIMHYFLNENDRKSYFSTLVYYMVMHYSRRMHVQMKYCDEDTFRYTLDNLTRTHLFYREKTIPNSLYYLATEVDRSFRKTLEKWDLENIIQFIMISRHRISQSVKSFAENYYRYKKEGIKITTQGGEDETETGSNAYQYKTIQRGQKVIDDVVKKITMYKNVDRKAFDEAKKISKVKTSIATIIVNQLTNSKHNNDIKIALNLFIKDLSSVSMICGSGYTSYVKKLMAVKRTTAQLYFKAQIQILIKNILDDADMEEAYEKYTSQTKFTINSFLAFYLTSIFRNSLC
jgi:hypothetical protein